jgi:vacuolar-type H+-ATPase subunit E/Vma4
MARGWESKSVESQMEMAEERLAQQKLAKLSADQVDLRQKRESLLLTRSRVVHDLDGAQNERYKVNLRAALAHVDEKLAELDKPPETVA